VGRKENKVTICPGARCVEELGVDASAIFDFVVELSIPSFDCPVSASGLYVHQQHLVVVSSCSSIYVYRRLLIR
jgi:hypothetical protein